MANQTEEIICLITTIAGGGAAGFLDVKFATKKVAGLPLGAVGGIALAGVGLFGSKLGLSSKICDYALDGAGGMLAFEAGAMVAQKTLASMLTAPSAAPAATSGVAGVGRMNPGYGSVHALRPGSQPDFMAQLTALENSFGRAA